MQKGANETFTKIVSRPDSGYYVRMKTTLDIEPELYAAAERLAQSQKKSLGQVVSELLRRTLGLSAGPDDASAAELERRNGFDVFSERTGPKATVEGVQQLCREEGI
jgi:hypothetical protein